MERAASRDAWISCKLFEDTTYSTGSIAMHFCGMPGHTAIMIPSEGERGSFSSAQSALAFTADRASKSDKHNEGLTAFFLLNISSTANCRVLLQTSKKLGAHAETEEKLGTRGSSFSFNISFCISRWQEREMIMTLFVCKVLIISS